MKRQKMALRTFALIFFFLAIPKVLLGYPTSLFWTPCNTDIIPPGYGNFQVSNYFSIINEGRLVQALQSHRVFPPDIGFSLGLGEWKHWKFEAGVDYLGGLRSPWLFNGKAGIEEDLLFTRAPSFAFSIIDVGTRPRYTNFNIVNFIVGKTLPKSFSGGRFFLGTYYGNSTLQPDRGSWMLGYLKTFFPAIDCKGVEYTKLWLVADYAHGKNLVGGGGGGIIYFFTPETIILTGPTWFNDVEINGRWKWTVQVYILFKVFNPTL